MEQFYAPITYLIILANVILSVKGFQNASFLEKSLFRTNRILYFKEYGRVFYSGFVHANWPHLIFNMYSLYSFGEILEASCGSVFFSCIYLASLMGSSLLSLFLHRHQPEYAALGASGAVNGVIFSTIVLFPGIPVFFGIPGWIFAIIYTLYTVYGMRSQMDNIGHDAHLGGAIFGIITTILFMPFVLETEPYLIASILVPSIVFLYLMVQQPHLIGLEPRFPQKRKTTKTDDHYNHIRAEKQKEMDRILEKINQSGMNSLSDYEKRFLDMNS
jgi:membrane associated rhomboid family serine protease